MNPLDKNNGVLNYYPDSGVLLFSASACGTENTSPPQPLNQSTNEGTMIRVLLFRLFSL